MASASELQRTIKSAQNFHVIVAYGVNISTIADNLVSNVKYKVEAFTGMEIDKIDIYVEGVRAIDQDRGGTCGE